MKHMKRPTTNRPDRFRAGLSNLRESKTGKGLKTAALAVAITAVYFAGIAVLLWPAVDAARLA